ncbi:MAG: hypothetical protein FJZ07_01650 [Candidatus Nealsonbacteria bacterium]|nr:hypothetical protein [Candidatus Nealsonbacteria bacterium]
MTKRTRNVLFLTLLALFLVAAPLAVLYSLGWRFDWRTKKIIQPGIFYFKVWPRNVEIYLDDKLEKKTDFFFGSGLIENLPPKKYEVEIKKENFHAWRKNLEIKEREVTEVKNIVLIPTNPRFSPLSEDVENFFFSPDGKKIILKEKDENGWGLKLFELNKNLKSHLIKEEDISRLGADLIDLEFSPDSKRIILKVGTKEKLIFYLLELDKIPPALTALSFPELEAEEVYFNPKTAEKLFFSEKGKLFEFTLTDKNISPSLLENIIAILISRNNVYYLDNTGFIFRTDFSFSARDKLNSAPLHLKKETEYRIVASDFKITLKEDDVLYIFDENKKLLEKVSEPVNNLKFSPDSKKFVYFNDYEIWLLFTEKIIEPPRKESGEKIFLTRFSEKIDNVFWYTSHYLIFNVGDKIKVAEIDDRDKINIYDLIEFPTPEIFWSNKKLYVLSKQTIYVSEELIL